MKSKFHLLILLILLGFNGFSTSPCDSTIANFNYSVNGLTVQLDGMPSGPFDTSRWYIYDANYNSIWTAVVAGDTSYTFANAGTYKVIFELEYIYDTVNDWACFDTIGQYITVGGGLTSPCDSISASYFTASVSGNTVTLTGFKSDPALGGYYGMGGTGNFTSGTSNTANATFVYDNPGTYIIDWTVSYWDSNTYCADTMYQTVTVGPSWSICDSVTNSYFYTAVSGNQVSVYGSTSSQASTYYDMGGTGTFISGNNNTLDATFVYDNPGTYTIEFGVYYYDTTLPGNYCADTVYETITIGHTDLDSSVCDSIQNGGVDYMVTVSGNQVTIDGWKPGLTDSYWYMGGTGTYTTGSQTTEDIVFVYDNSGTYEVWWYVEYWDSNFYCADTIIKTITVGDSLSGIADKYKDIRLTTYPNPFDNEFTINMNLDKEVIIDLELLNSIGQVLYAEELNSFDLQNRTISASDLESGVYMLMLRDKENDQIIKTQRLVKK